ncbi:MAG TPA: DNA gyrase subunit A [Candidatus Avimonoglobus intestinipullorum]|uniref:DNA gyrase subunit A n=1 Tax=Candidatus Avimonoglobus intestinipullorum TaxID=2840699 RepID=A0A9D1LTK6_9FIRM|nr:DNA gyrase subunit A [Candidatus Avimonoglobus intestinipullorum]
MAAIENQKIVDVDLNSEMKKSYISYAMSVIASRALPDVRDGLKPVHRRILYDMYENNLLYESDFRKCATTVGDVLGKYHPHGDASVYDAMVRLAQDFSLRYPLILGKGNFGSIDGDPAAAYRYTESKMTKLSAEMLSDIEKETVDFVPNYDDKRKEPDVLPSRFPNLLVNGSAGIAVGMATNIPPHNLSETIDGITAVIDDPNITIEELMGYIKGPDFPTGGVIMGLSGIRSAYATGKGRIIVRAKAEIEELDSGRSRIVVTELPYQVNKARLEKHINELARDGKIDGIASTRDESDENIHLIIELKRDANPNVVLNNLYKFTQMQETFGVILLALVDKEPKILNLREIIDHYIHHQEDVITRRTQFDLRKAEEHAHLLEGYRIAIDHIDEVINLIRSSKSIPDAKVNLSERYSLSDVQATAIVQMPLGRLSGLERDKIETDYAQTMAKIEEYRALLADEHLILNIVKEDLQRIKDKYGDERRTEITMVTDELDIEDLIDEEEVVITMTHSGYTKRLPVDTYKSQHRGGRGISGMATREEDFVEQIFTTSTHDTILFFSTRGVVYRLKGYQIPEAGRQAKGTAIVNLLPLEPEEKITTMIPISDFEEGKFLTFITKNGTVKKTDLMDYARIRSGGLRAIELADGDELIRVKLTDNNQHIIIGTHDGYAIRFHETDVRPMGRTAHGVRGIRLNEGDYVVGASVALENSQLLVVTENGYGKKTSLDEYKVQTRGGKGIFTYRITDKTGKVAGLKTVTDQDDIMLITSDGVLIRMHASEISTFGRQTQGVRIMRLDEGVQVVGLARTAQEEEDDAPAPSPETQTEA